MISCPVCQQPLVLADKEAYCAQNHRFDRARQGYYNLHQSHRKHHGDDRLMVDARRAFLEAGFYQPLREAMVSLLKPLALLSMLDLGCGEGYYTHYLKKELTLREVVGIDISKEALKRASVLYPDINWLVASIAHLPILEESFDAALVAFAPRYYEEFARILKPQGYLLQVNSGPKHLIELKEQLYEVSIDNPPIETSAAGFELVRQEMFSTKVPVENIDLVNLLDMTPYRYKSKIERVEWVQSLPCLDITFEFVLTLFKKQ